MLKKPAPNNILEGGRLKNNQNLTLAETKLTVNSTPSGVNITIDGVQYTTPATYTQVT